MAVETMETACYLVHAVYEDFYLLLLVISKT